MARKKTDNPYLVFNKLILFTAEAYLSKSVEDGLTIEPLHKKIISGIRAYMVMGRFSKEETKLLQKLGEHKYMQDLKKTEIAFVVYALELLRLYTEEVPQHYRKNIYLGVGNKGALTRHTVDITFLLESGQSPAHSNRADSINLP